MILKGISICNEHRSPEADYYLLHFRLLPSSGSACALYACLLYKFFPRISAIYFEIDLLMFLNIPLIYITVWSSNIAHLRSFNTA